MGAEKVDGVNEPNKSVSSLLQDVEHHGRILVSDA